MAQVLDCSGGGGHITRSTGLAKMILQGTVQGGRRKGRQKRDGKTT